MASNSQHRPGTQANSPPKRAIPPGWTPAKLDRLDSYLPQILAALRPDDPVEELGGALKSGSINWFGDHWHRYSSGAHGPDVLSLLVELLGSEARALAYAEQWLATYPGSGVWQGIDTEAGAAKAETNVEKARHWLDRRVSYLGTPAERYLVEERQLHLRAGLENTVSYVADVRLGEGALVGTLVDSASPDVVLGLQLGFLDPRGQHLRNKKGKRDRWVLFATLDPDARRRACFHIEPLPLQAAATTGPDDVALASTTILVEGFENALAAATACPYATVIGVSGIGRLGGLALFGQVVVLRDNDGDDAPATAALEKGLDALLLAEVPVKVTNTPAGRDAADYVRDGQFVALRQLILDAKKAKLTRDGELTRLSRLPWEDYLSERKAAAKLLGWPTKDLDAAVAARRSATDDSSSADSFSGALGSEDMHPEPVSDIAGVCDAAFVQLKKYPIASDNDLAAAVIWALHAHFVHHETIVLDISPRMLFEAKGAECGKTTAMEAVSCLTPRYLRVSRISAAAFADVVDSYRVTLFVDELDKLLRQRQQTDLHAILLTGHRRHEAFRPLRVPSPDGRGWQTHLQRTWLTFGGTAIAGQVIEDQQRSRLIVITLPRATQEEAKRLQHLKRGTCLVLDEARRRFARWAMDRRELPEIKLPEVLYNRAGDNWEPLLQIASAVGGHWPTMIERAALKAISDVTGDDGNLPKSFLDDLRRLLLPEGKAPLPHMWTKDITLRLKALDDPHADWTRAYQGTEITDYWTGRMLAHWLHPDKPKSIRHGNQQFKGVYTSQLLDIFERHPETSPGGVESATPTSKSVPSVPSVPDGKDAVTNIRKSGTHSKFRSVPVGSVPSQIADAEGLGPDAEGLGRNTSDWDGSKFETVPQQHVDNIAEIRTGTDGTDGTGLNVGGAFSTPPLSANEQPKVAGRPKTPRKPRSKVNGGTQPDPEQEARDRLPDLEVEA